MERYGQDIDYDMSSIIKRHDGPYTLYSEAITEIEKRNNIIVEQGMQMEETYKVLEGEKVCDFSMSFGLVSKAADRMAEIAAKDKEIAELKADLSKPPQERTYCKGCSLPRLTTLINDNERAERAAIQGGHVTSVFDCRYCYGRYQAINDYRADLKEEMGK